MSAPTLSAEGGTIPWLSGVRPLFDDVVLADRRDRACLGALDAVGGEHQTDLAADLELVEGLVGDAVPVKIDLLPLRRGGEAVIRDSRATLP